MRITARIDSVILIKSEALTSELHKKSIGILLLDKISECLKEMRDITNIIIIFSIILIIIHKPYLNDRRWSVLSVLCSTHSYTREIPEPAPFLSWHAGKIGGLQVFPVIKITMVRQVHITYIKYICGLRVKKTICVVLFLRVWSVKTRRPPIWAQQLRMPLHRAVYKVWNLPCISVVLPFPK